MITFGRVSLQTRGVSQDPKFYEDLVTCEVGGMHIRAGSPCTL